VGAIDEEPLMKIPKIVMTLYVPDGEDVDEGNSTGLTGAAYARLYHAVIDAGFEFDSGPRKATAWES
jgi:hypothetical protein